VSARTATEVIHPSAQVSVIVRLRRIGLLHNFHRVASYLRRGESMKRRNMSSRIRCVVFCTTRNVEVMAVWKALDRWRAPWVALVTPVYGIYTEHGRLHGQTHSSKRICLHGPNQPKMHERRTGTPIPRTEPCTVHHLTVVQTKNLFSLICQFPLARRFP